jgi:hypothetical protein
MSKTLTFELPDEVFHVLQQKAAQTGRSFEELALEFLLKHRRKPTPPLSDEERKAARERLMRHIGAQALGHATGADNESIDADLAREYGISHEES